MRLVNNRFADESKYFWDERAGSLEEQSTMPIMDHVEMGYSGSNGDEDINALLEKLDAIPYYNDLFYLAFGDTVITEDRMQRALAQFIRSIQSFDAPYDEGRAQVSHDTMPFPNFNNQQNMGKDLFITPAVFDNTSSRIGGGLGCANCHRPPEFDIVPDSKSNGVVFTPGNTTPNGGVDTVVFKSPSLRDVVNQDGQVNGNLMHTANFVSLTNVLNHYDRINLFPQVQGIADVIDDRLLPNGRPQDLNMTNQERNRVIAFLGTLTGSDVYTNPKWSDPFDVNGDLEILNSPLITSSTPVFIPEIKVYPNPFKNDLFIEAHQSATSMELYKPDGTMIQSIELHGVKTRLPFQQLDSGMIFLIFKDENGKYLFTHKVIKF